MILLLYIDQQYYRVGRSSNRAFVVETMDEVELSAFGWEDYVVVATNDGFKAFKQLAARMDRESHHLFHECHYGCTGGPPLGKLPWSIKELSILL